MLSTCITNKELSFQITEKTPTKEKERTQQQQQQQGTEETHPPNDIKYPVNIWNI